MGQRERSQKKDTANLGHEGFSGHKGSESRILKKSQLLFARLFLFLFPFSPLILTQCTTSQKEKTPVHKSLLSPVGLILRGSNRHPLFVDNKRILFLSSHRLQHELAQIYLANFQSGRERRLTHLDGDIYDMSYDGVNQRIYFSSDTDELKENPDMKRLLEGEIITPKSNLHEEFPKAEIYSMDLRGRKQRRLTRRPGFDGQVFFANSRIHFLRISGTAKIISMRPSGGSQKTLLSGTKAEKIIFALTPNGQTMAWIQRDSEGKRHLLAGKTGTKASNTLLSSETIKDIEWHPNGEWLTYVDMIQQKFGIYALRLKDRCTVLLTSREENAWDPAFSPDGKKLAFASDRSGQLRLFVADWPEISCPPIP